MNCLQTTMITI